VSLNNISVGNMIPVLF